jgi:hypothetical protein
MYGRHFDHTDEIVSSISRKSIDACKDYFRDVSRPLDGMCFRHLSRLGQ